MINGGHYKNGFLVAPGSIHKSGKQYQWNEIGEIATIPEEWLVYSEEQNTTSREYNYETNLSTAKKLKDITLPAKLTPDYSIKDGERELTLFKWGARERGKGATADYIYDILITIRDTYCETGDEPVSDEEIRNIADSVATYPTNYEKQSMALKS